MASLIVPIISFGFFCGLVDINKSFRSTSRAVAIFNNNSGRGCVFPVNIKLIVFSETPTLSARDLPVVFFYFNKSLSLKILLII